MAKEFIYEIASFGGLSDPVDRQGSPGDHQSPDMVNFTLTEDHRLKKREGFRTVKKFEGEIRGIWSGLLDNVRHWFAVDCIRVWHSLTGFSEMEQVGTLPGHLPVQIVEFGGKLFFLSGEGIRVFAPGEGFRRLSPYRPLLMSGCSPSGEGTVVEDANALGGMCRQRFTPTEQGEEYRLCVQEIDSVDYVKVMGSPLPADRYEVDLQAGIVYFNEIPNGFGPDSVEIGFTKYSLERSKQIDHCRFACVYGGSNDTSLFLWGNEECPAMRFHSGYAEGIPDGEYFPETHYTRIGDGAALTGILRHYDRQLIFTREGAFYSYPESITDELGRVRVRFPVYPLSDAAGNLAPGYALLMNNDPVTVSRGGLCRWSSSTLRDEKNARLFSQPIGKALSRWDLRELKLFWRQSKAWLYVTGPEGEIYVYAPALQAFWRLRGPELFSAFEDGITGQWYFGTRDGRLCLVGGTEDDGEPIEAYWSSGELDLGQPVHSKNLHRINVWLAPEESAELEIGWEADSRGHNLTNSGRRRFTAREKLFGFSELSFSPFSFLTSYHSRSVGGRVAVRRFGKIRFWLYARDGKGLQIEALRLRGIVNHKKM